MKIIKANMVVKKIKVVVLLLSFFLINILTNSGVIEEKSYEDYS